MRKWIFMLGFALATCACGVSLQAQRQRYLQRADVPSDIRLAIASGRVIEGMDPFQVRMAKGEPCYKLDLDDQTLEGQGVVEHWLYCAVCRKPIQTPAPVTFNPETGEIEPRVPTLPSGFIACAGETTLVRFAGGKVAKVPQVKDLQFKIPQLKDPQFLPSTPDEGEVGPGERAE